MKVTKMEDIEMEKSLELSPESKFIKNILIKAKSGKLHESVIKNKDIHKLCESFNRGEVVLTPVDENEVVMAYDPRITECKSGVIISGHSYKGRTGEPNVTIKLTPKEFYDMLSVR